MGLIYDKLGKYETMIKKNGRKGPRETGGEKHGTI